MEKQLKNMYDDLQGLVDVTDCLKNCACMGLKEYQMLQVFEDKIIEAMNACFEAEINGDW